MRVAQDRRAVQLCGHLLSPLTAAASKLFFRSKGDVPQAQKGGELEMLGELQTWSPIQSVLQELNPFREDADKLFERFFGKDSFELDIPMLPAVESFIEDGKLCMRFDLPGVDPKDIDVSVAGNTVTIRASRERRSNQGDGHFKRTEVSYGRFERLMPLPEGVKAEQVKATYRNGVLELSAPVSPELAGRKIPVEIGAEQPTQLETKSAA
jgi:HSP20 family protein